MGWAGATAGRVRRGTGPQTSPGRSKAPWNKIAETPAELGHLLARSIKDGDVLLLHPRPTMDDSWDFAGRDGDLAIFTPSGGSLSNGATPAHTSATPACRQGQASGAPQTAFVDRRQETTLCAGLVDRARQRPRQSCYWGRHGGREDAAGTEVAAYAAARAFSPCWATAMSGGAVSVSPL